MLTLGPSRPAPAGATLTLLSKLDPLLQRQSQLFGHSPVLVAAQGSQALTSTLAMVPLLGGHVVRSLPLINAAAVELPNAAITSLAANPLVARLS